MGNKPSAINRLTKAQILQGRNHTEEVEIPALNGSVTIRILTSGEIEYVKGLPARGIHLSMQEIEQLEGKSRADAKLNFDMEAMFAGQAEAAFVTVAFGLTLPDAPKEERWTVEDARSITPPEAVEQIAKEVWRISKVDESDFDMFQRFRDE